MAKYKIQDNMIPTIHRGSEVLYLNYNKPITILIGGEMKEMKIIMND